MASIVVVEDDGALRFALRERLAEWGHTVHDAGDAATGYEAIREHRPDVVLSDVNMPDASGLDLVEQVIRDDVSRDAAFIFISSEAAPAAIIRGIDSGADDYIPKPIDFKLLKTKINSHLRKRDTLLAVAAEERVAASIGSSMLKGAYFVSSIAITGIVALLVLYWFKVALGIDILQSSHLSDWF